MKATTFFTLCGGFLAGVFFHSIVDINFQLIILFLTIGISLLFLGFINVDSRKIFIITSLFFLAFSLGLIRFAFDIEDKTGLSVSGKPEFFEGILIREPEYRERSTHLVVSVDGVLILLYANVGEQFLYGDKLRFFGELKKAENFESDNGRVFDYANFLAARGISFVIQSPRIEIISRGEGSLVKEKLFYIKSSFLNSIEKSINAPESSLLAGLLLGVKQSLGKDWEDIFRRAGLSHVVVLSGFNIAIVGTFFMWCFGFFGKRLKIIFGAIAIFLFAIMTGGEASVVRASAMALVVLAAHSMYRRYDITRALILVGLIMVAISPKILVFDISFQLSFLATVGIIYATPVIERLFQWLTNKIHIRDIVVTTLSTQLFVSPFILYAMGTFSIVSLPANLLVLPLVPIAMFLGLIVGVLGLISQALSTPFSFVVYFILHFQLSVAKFFGNLKIATITIEPFSAWWLLIVYGLILFVIILYSRNDSRLYRSLR
jgi:competence protein ComEC